MFRRVGTVDILNVICKRTAVLRPVATRGIFTKYLTIYHKIILSFSQDGLTIVTYNVIRILLRIS